MDRIDHGPEDWSGESDGTRIGPESGRSARVYALPGGGLAMLLSLLGALAWVAHNPSGHSAVKSRRGTFLRHSAPASAVAFGPEGRVLATVHSDGRLKIMDLSRDPDHPREIEIGPGKIVTAVAFSPDGKILASCGEGPTLTLWDVGSATLRASLEAPGSTIRKLAFSPDGKTLAVGSLEGTVTLRDVETGREVSRLAGHLGSIRGLAFSPDGKTLAVGAFRGDVRLWDVAGGRELVALRYPDRLIYSLTFDPDGKNLAFALKSTKSDQKSGVAIWTPAGGPEAIRVLGQTDIDKVAFSSDGHILAATTDHLVKLWDVETGREFASLEGHDGYINSLCFSPDDQLLATSSLDMLVGLFRIDLEKLKASRP
jgi:WD40 repeat protein